MDEALRLYNAGQLEPALHIASRVAEVRPRFALAHNLVGAIQVAAGRSPEAVKAFQRAIRLDDTNPQFHANLGETERQRGKLREAGISLNRAVELDPRSFQALNNLGIVHFDRKEYEEACAFYRRAVAVNPDYPEAHNNLGNALRMLDKTEEALEEYQKALMIREDYPEAYNNLATILREQDQPVEAEHAYRKAIDLNPRYLDAYNNLAQLLVGLDRRDEALRVLGSALDINPQHVETLLQVARVQLEKGSFEPAEKACRVAIELEPGNARTHATLGEVLNDIERFEEAATAYEAALEIDPELWDVRNHYGNCLKSLGRLDEARAELLRSLEINPKALGVYTNLSDLEKYTPDNPRFIEMQKVLEEAEDPMDRRYTALHFAMGKAYDDVGEHEKAIDHYISGAKLKRATLDYEEAESISFFNGIEETYDAEFLANPPFEGHPSDKPVFIVGMPRSGSTLIEQILSSHPQTYGGGETKEISRRLGSLRSRFPALPKYPELGTRMNTSQYKLVADGYIDTQSALAGDVQRMTDKLLSNFYFVGFLHVMFPNAKFIHTARNPVDSCISTFSKLFKDDMPHSYDFGELSRYYKRYQKLMAHWEKILPPGIMATIAYEDVVENLEDRSRELVDFVGLQWDPACLAFHESARPVRTASVVQVRSPVYTTSVGRWRRYGPAIQPLADALGVTSP
ncbi:tetratricopeptide repeat-containing sulfotransferase family protein [Bauldia sp.]|uniref:tetratricopeptide repeat-containing sulfotransferase family protein n=1 Tax=Bauldia sp. TaxID=2575872 RepID=UPI003BAC2C84